MFVASTREQLTRCLTTAVEVSPDKPVVISKFISHAKEIEFDAVARRGEILNFAITEHIENAGVHSGDATLVLPAQRLYVGTVRAVKRIASEIARALRVDGPVNIQFLAIDNNVLCIECNLRTSRSFPFISKTLGANFVSLAAKVLLGLPCRAFNINLADYDFVAVKAPLFSFTRLRGADPTLGVEMSSTGEVACFGAEVPEAFLQALVATGFRVPDPADTTKVILLSIAEDSVRSEFVPALRQLARRGFCFAATPGTAAFFNKRLGPELTCTTMLKPNGREGPHRTALDAIVGGEVSLLINVPEGTARSDEITAGYRMRRAAVDYGIALIGNLHCALLFAEALHRNRPLPCKSVEEYLCHKLVGRTVSSDESAQDGLVG